MSWRQFDDIFNVLKEKIHIKKTIEYSQNNSFQKNLKRHQTGEIGTSMLSLPHRNIEKQSKIVQTLKHSQ